MEFHPGTQPQEVLNRVNRLLYEKSLPHQFVTLFLFFLSPNGNGQFISAGHNPAYMFRSATGKVENLVSDLFVLGMFDSSTYQSSPLHLCQGDLLVVYSDGLTDARNRQDDMFGEERLLKLIQGEAPFGSQILEQKLLKAIEEFTEGMPQTDDITFVLVERFQ
jgi:sigma-B regulation protein RsbU (phosphoserine phosphatase)